MRLGKVAVWRGQEAGRNGHTAPGTVAKSHGEAHENIHQSAVDIAKEMNKFNVDKESTTFYNLEIAHRKWVATVIKEILG